jgi:hypothetical protein
MKSIFTALERLESWRSRAATARNWSRGIEVDRLESIIDELDADDDARNAELDRLRAALTKIACYNDLSAWKQQRAHNSYSHFDEPGSVQIAHEAIAKAAQP